MPPRHLQHVRRTPRRVGKLSIADVDVWAGRDVSLPPIVLATADREPGARPLPVDLEPNGNRPAISLVADSQNPAFLQVRRRTEEDPVVAMTAPCRQHDQIVLGRRAQRDELAFLSRFGRVVEKRHERVARCLRKHRIGGSSDPYGSRERNFDLRDNLARWPLTLYRRARRKEKEPSPRERARRRQRSTIGPCCEDPLHPAYPALSCCSSPKFSDECHRCSRTEGHGGPKRACSCRFAAAELLRRRPDGGTPAAPKRPVR